MDILLSRLGVQNLQPRSILIGGGTPTDLSVEQLRRFLEAFTARVRIGPGVQFNYDVDPATLTGTDGEARLRSLREYGVNRLTIGVQSLRDDILRSMNRDHDAATARTSVASSLAMGFKVNIEFIFGYPGQTLDTWLDVIEEAIRLGPDEIQLYRLKVVPYGDQRGTIERVRQVRSRDIPGLADTMMMKQAAIHVLREHGYTENLRRVFTRDRANISRYAFNQCCMLFDQVGIGQTAFSSLRDRFALNTPSFDEYYGSIAAGHLPVNRGLVRSLDDQMRWAIILPLKNYSLRPRHFHRATGVALESSPFHARLQILREHGLVDVAESEFRLTPLGAFFADEVVELFHARPYIPFPESNYEPGLLNPYSLNPA
jgi:oxygen-independent coproporphyrinogen-3 oxidase